MTLQFLGVISGNGLALKGLNYNKMDTPTPQRVTWPQTVTDRGFSAMGRTGTQTDRPRSAEYLEHCNKVCEPGSSVSIVSGYGLNDRAIEVRSPAEAKVFL
jgi:hypothetical protein